MIGQSPQARSSVVAVLVCLALVAAACSASPSNNTGAAEGDPTSAPEPATTEPEATAVVPDVVSTSAPPTPDPNPTAEPGPTAAAEPAGPIPDFRGDNILGISTDARFAYAGTTTPWRDPSSCDAQPFEALAGIDATVASAGDARPFEAGLKTSGDVVQVVFGADGSAAILLTCGEQQRSWVQSATFDASGIIVDLSLPLVLSDTGSQRLAVIAGVEGDHVMIETVIEDDPDDLESWVIQTRTVSLTTGDVIDTQERPFFDENGLVTASTFTTPDGQFTYSEAQDPGGRLGCEGASPAVTISVDDGSGPKPALGSDGLVFSDLSDLHFGPDGLVAWTSSCEGFTSAYVGRMLDDGSIADAHFVSDIDQIDRETFVNLVHYRLADDGFLVGVGPLFAPNSDPSADPIVHVVRYDLGSDPKFVQTADPQPEIDEEPLGDRLGGSGSWFVGETTGREPACGASTLYGSTSTGLVRAFDSGVEIDAIVDFDIAETQTVSFEDGFGGQGSFMRRTMVFSTECPDDYQGRRIWFGDEPEDVHFGVFLARADAPEVAEVLAVTEVLRDESNFPEMVIAEVEFLDGTVGEVELEPLISSGG